MVSHPGPKPCLSSQRPQRCLTLSQTQPGLPVMNSASESPFCTWRCYVIKLVWSTPPLFSRNLQGFTYLGSQGIASLPRAGAQPPGSCSASFRSFPGSFLVKRDVILSRADRIWRFLRPTPAVSGKVSASGNTTTA